MEEQTKNHALTESRLNDWLERGLTMVKNVDRNELIKIARDCEIAFHPNGETPKWWIENVARFADRIALAERNECAAICDGSTYDEVRDIAEKIRERSNAEITGSACGVRVD